LRAVERADAVQGPERHQQHRVAALHVARAGADELVALAAGTPALEDRVEMPDEEQAPAARSRALGEQVARPLDLGRQVDPAGGEPQLFQPAAVKRPGLLHSREVFGGAVDADALFEERKEIGLMLVDIAGDASFGGGSSLATVVAAAPARSAIITAGRARKRFLAGCMGDGRA
jgi:hypothetical protein